MEELKAKAARARAKEKALKEELEWVREDIRKKEARAKALEEKDRQSASNQGSSNMA